MCRLIINKFRQNQPDWQSEINHAFLEKDIELLHKSIPEYYPTPLEELPGLAERLNLGNIYVKDESHRFGLRAFKALGASYAIFRFIKSCFEGKDVSLPKTDKFYTDTGFLEPNKFTFTTATDGNHGRAVAWISKKLGQRAVVYMPENSVRARIKAIENENAEVVVVRGSYDDAVVACRQNAVKNRWQIISDTSWQDYTRIPFWIQAGYLTMFAEIHELQRPDINIDAVLVQGGVGAFASAAAWYYNKIYIGKKPVLISVEPVNADCLLQSADTPEGLPISVNSDNDSIMAGLNCWTPSPTAWHFIKTGFDLFLSIPDKYSIEAMRTYYYPVGDDPRITSGESGAAGLGALLAIHNNNTFKKALDSFGICSDSNVLVINTEGITDPTNFNKCVIEYKS